MSDLSIEQLNDMAWRMFSAQRKARELEGLVEDAITRILGGDPDQYEERWFTDITFDDYDNSFELKGCRELFELTEEQKCAFGEMGFSRAWCCLGAIGNHDTARQRYYAFKQKALKPTTKETES